MVRDWESQFREWAKPPGKTEQDRCDNAVSAIRNAIGRSAKLNTRNIHVFTQGSYQNNTNVRQDSDVDIGVVCYDTFFYTLPEGLTAALLDITPATYHYEQFKNEIEEALVAYFGRSAVRRGNKAFDVHETSYHVEADVAAFFEHRRYQPDKTYLQGVELQTDKEHHRIINWPEQHYENGVDKNKRTGTRFKSIVRILKALSVEMAEKSLRSGDIPGFLIECLVWNVPDNCFGNSQYSDDVEESLTYLFRNTETDDLCREWGEVSELKYLFNPYQKWTRQQAHDFITTAWTYLQLGG